MGVVIKRHRGLSRGQEGGEGKEEGTVHLVKNWLERKWNRREMMSS